MQVILYLNTRQKLNLVSEIVEVDVDDEDFNYLDKLELKIMKNEKIVLVEKELKLLKKYNINITKYKSKDIYR